MSVTLKGPSPASLTAGILLLSRSRSFGLPIEVEIVGDPAEITPVLGPAMVHSTVLAGCGVGRDYGAGGLVVLPGPSTHALAMSLAPEGAGEWFTVDRDGHGVADSTRSFVRMNRSRNPGARQLGKELRRGLMALGVSSEPAVLDLLFAAPEPPAMRLALALRASGAMNQTKAPPLSRFLMEPQGGLPDSLEGPVARTTVLAAHADGRAATMLDRFNVRTRDEIELWLDDVVALMQSSEEFDPLISSLAELVSHVTSLPVHGLVPLLGAHLDALAVGLGGALGAVEGEPDANRQLRTLFEYLGGRFIDSARYPVEIDAPDAPEGRLARWQWFADAAQIATTHAEAVWRSILDPAQ